MIIVMMIIMIATNIPTNLDQACQNELKADNASATHKARINSWTIEIDNGPIVNVIPASNPLLMFLGYTTFILMNHENLK